MDGFKFVFIGFKAEVDIIRIQVLQDKHAAETSTTMDC